MDRILRLTPLESAIGMPIGLDEGVSPLRERHHSLGPQEAIERAVLPALQRAPCLVAFSGGRDSSTMLAVAARVARREGLPLPIAYTYVFPEQPQTEEAYWQERVIRHLDLPDWQRRAFTSEFDMLGPLAQKVMERHGLVAPAAAFNLVPSLQDAGGGSVITGVDGDGLFGDWTSARVWAVLRGHVVPQVRDVLRLGKLLAPIRVKRAWLDRQKLIDVSWLRPQAASEAQRRWAEWWAAEPTSWNHRAAWWAHSRLMTVVSQTLDLLAADAGARIFHPFMDPGFLAAVSSAGGRSGFGDRTRTMHQLFGALLPAEVLSRTDKADFTLVYWTERTRRFASGWNGEGVPTDLVDPMALRNLWTSESPDMRSGILLQAAWLAASGANQIEHSFNCGFG